MVLMPLLVEKRLRLGADPGNDPDPQRVEEPPAPSSGAHDGQAVRLLEVRGDLGDELVRPDADRAGETFADKDVRLEHP